MSEFDSQPAASETLYRRSIGRTAWCDLALPAQIAHELLHGNADRVLFAAAPLQVKDRCIAARLDHGSGSLLVKRHTWGGWARTLRMGWREPPSRKCARLAELLLRSGIATPRPRACIENRIGPYAYRSYLLTDFVEGTSLYRFIRFGEHSAELLERLAEQVAAMWQRLVELGLSHCDMKPENFIVDPSYRVWLIDLERVREPGRTLRQSRYQIADAKNFLHIRGWHRRPLAHQIFANALLGTAAARRFQPELGFAIEQSKAANQHDRDLSVVVLANGDSAGPAPEQLPESLHDLADEIVVAAPARSGDSLKVLGRIAPCNVDLRSQWRPAIEPKPALASSDWVLVLYQGESVTPVLSRKIQDEIAKREAVDAYSISVAEHLFDGCFATGQRTARQEIRLFRQSACQFSIRGGQIVLAANPQRTGKLVGAIQTSIFSNIDELADRLNEESSQSAKLRLDAGERPRWLRAIAGAVRHLLRQTLTPNALHNGWAGLQAALLEAAFICAEEAKLAQMLSQFKPYDRSDSAENFGDELPAITLPLPSPSARQPAAKAA